MKFKRITWLVIFTFCCTILGPFMTPAAANAAGTSEIIAELNNLYQYIDQNDKTYLKEARANIGSLSESEWNTILGSTVITSKVIGVFGSEEKAKTALKAFATDFSNIYYSPDPNTMESSINNFRKNHSTTFHTLFGTDVTVDSVFTLLSNTCSRIGANIKSTDLDKLAWGTNDELIAIMPEVLKRALADAITEPFAGKLGAIGWSTDMLIDTKNTINGYIDSNHYAELALARAAVRSQSKTYLDLPDPQTDQIIKLDETLKIKPGTNDLTFKLTIMDRLATGVVDWNSSNPNFVLSKGGYGNILTIPTDIKAGDSTKITAYRAHTEGKPEVDWLARFTVVVDQAPVNQYTVNAKGNIDGAGTISGAGNYIGGENATLTAEANNGYYFLKWTENGTDVSTSPSYTFKVSANRELVAVFAILKQIPSAGGTIDASSASVALKVQNVATEGDVKKATLPELKVTGGAAEVSIPTGTVVQGPKDWDGIMVMPMIRTEASAKVDGTVATVIEVGAAGKDANGKDIVLTFEKAVRLLISEQKGKAAAYTRNGKLIKIKQTLSADTQDVADRNIPWAGEDSIDVGNDKAIWTKHFTEFLTYTPTPSSPGGGGGGSGTSSWTTIKSAEGGKVSAYGATAQIPANAIELKEFKIKIEKVRDTSELPLVSGTKILGTVVDITTNTATNFTKPITITLNFDKSKIDTSKYDISLCWLKTSTSKWIELDNVKIDLDAGKISGEVNHFTKFAVIATEKAGIEPPVTPPVTPTPIVLTDITGHWGEANIQKLVNIGAISGYPDKTFKPDANISRAEFAVTLVKALKLDPKNGKIFSDTTNHWAKDSIATAQAYGIISGYSDTKFGPDDKITREQMAVMITKAADLTAGANSKAFTDSARVSTWAKDAVNIASSNGIINGYPDGSFKPQANATRAEAVTVIAKILK